MFALTFICIFALSAAAVFRPKPCCAPKKFQATLEETGGQINLATGTPAATDILSKLYYDYDSKKIRVDRNEYKDEGSIDSYTIVMNYITNTTYYIKGSYCQASLLDAAMQTPCIPDSANYTGRHVIGSYSSHLTVDSWSIDVRNNTILFAVTTDDCTPVLEYESRSSPTAVSRISMVFSQFQAGNFTDSVFAIPANCSSSSK